MKVRLEHTRDQNDPRDFSVDKDWPAVPREGEYIELRDGEDEPVTGTVRVVLWDDSGVPLVRFR